MYRIRHTLLVAAALVVAGLAWSPDAAPAQERARYQIDAQGGLALPVGATSDIWESSINSRLSFTYWFDESFGVRVDGSRDGLTGKDAADLSGPFNAPDATFWQATAGLAWEVLDPDDSFVLGFDVGGGFANVSSDDFPADVEQPSGAPEPDFEITDFSETYPAFTAGVKVGYRFTPRFSAYLGGRGNYIGSDTQEMEDFAAFDPDTPVSFTPLWTMPVQVGVSVTF